jgi:tripartite ATP-independent transporter DctP family solute receptor
MFTHRSPSSSHVGGVDASRSANRSGRRLRRSGAALIASLMLVAACAGEEPAANGPAAPTPAPAPSAPVEQPRVVMDYAHALPATHPYHECGVEALPELLVASGSNIELRTFAGGSAFGSTAEQLDALVAGELAMTLGGPGQVAAWDERVSVLDVLYLWESGEELKEVLDGPLGEELWGGLLETAGLRVLGLGQFGTRHLTANKRVTSPADMAGLKLRVVEGTIYRLNGRVLGGDPTPIAFPELYTALQQGVADAQENPLSNIRSSGFQEVQDYVMLTGHLVQYFPTVISDQIWQSLTEFQQEALQAAVDEAMLRVDACQSVIDEEILAEWRAPGSPIIVVEADEIDIEAFRARAAELYPGDMAAAWGDLYERLLAEIARIRG